MGLLEQSVDFLESIRGQVRADLMRSRCFWKAGEFQLSKELVQELLTREDGGLEVFQWASELFSHLDDQSSHAALERKVLTCSGGMEAFAAYSREMRKGVRFELPESIARFLELQYDCFPSSLGNLWLEDVFWGWNLSLLANHYHQTAPDFPKRVARNYDLSLTSCLFDLFEEFDTSASRNLRASLGRNSVGWDLDWSQWAWRYERVFASGFWQSVQQGDRQKADRFLKSAYRLNPEQINTLIDAVPWVLEKFDRETLKEWFMIYYAPMQEHLRKYPEDSLIANNAAWLAVKCGFEIDRALELSLEVTKRYPTDTYLDTLAEVYFAKGETDRAIEISLACQRLNPRDPHHHRQLSRFRAIGSLRR
jgi:tetratricopeptide (TPR) repeat protein